MVASTRAHAATNTRFLFIGTLPDHERKGRIGRLMIAAEIKETYAVTTSKEENMAKEEGHPPTCTDPPLGETLHEAHMFW